MKKKILFITTISGFLPQFEMQDVEILKNMGYEVHYASNFSKQIYEFDENELKEKGIVLHPIDIEKSPGKIIKNLRAIRQLRQIIEEEQIHMVHCHNPMGGVAGRVAAHQCKKNIYVIYTAHGLHFYKGAPLKNWLFYYPVEKFLAKWTDAMVTINQEDDGYIRKKFRLKKNGIYIKIPGVGVDLRRFSPRPEIGLQKRKELGVPERALHIVTAAELNANKNQLVVIEALRELKDPEIYYSICGQGPYEEKLRNRIRKYGLEKQIRLLGYREDMDLILQSADIFALPSQREGLGMAAIEALACGVPLLVADNRGTREYAKDGENALVCKANNCQEYKQKIDKLQKLEKFRDNLKKNTRKSAEAFGKNETARIMRELYEKADRMILDRG